ncbi:MAG: DNA repair protein RadA [Bacteroidales bacterium]|nr:DNA repair protein RadA [Bacteroidales bacterium]MBR3745153.1 DNA repair protein RadA [Bacteroidales bacterium]
MASAKTLWYCTNCGNESPKWMGRCPACGEWNTMVEAPVEKKGSKGGAKAVASGSKGERKPLRLKEIDRSKEPRLQLGMPELDRLLGGGIVPGSLVLIGGEPGIGKSTLSLQIPLVSGLKTLYVTGEESARQVKMRADRLCGGAVGESVSGAFCRNGLRSSAEETDSPAAPVEDTLIFTETRMESILEQAEEIRPELMIVDSVQTMFTDTVESTPGSVSQIKEVAAMLLRFAKESGIPVLLIGHITKDGYIAGPKILEHIVDVVLQFEGENRGAYRILRSIKNRFGSTSEIAVFEMTGAGLREVANPSEMLIPMHEAGLSGAAICATLDGTRPLLFEVQALVSSAVYGTAQRSATGFDTRRLNMLLAVLEKRAGFHLSAKDVFLNMAGGLKVSDPAADLAVVAAVLSSNFDYSLPGDSCFAGEVGLSGEIRPVANTDRRIGEAARLGFKRIYVSSFTPLGEQQPKEIKIVKVADVPALVKALFKNA